MTEALKASCRNCHRKACRPRGMCDWCYRRPEVRALVPVTSKYGRRGEGHGVKRVKACQPTMAPCGSAEKVEVMRLRLLNGEALTHPADNPDTLAKLDPAEGLAWELKRKKDKAYNRKRRRDRERNRDEGGG